MTRAATAEAQALGLRLVVPARPCCDAAGSVELSRPESLTSYRQQRKPARPGGPVV
ncbi:hypothetical protein [Xylanimonas oleitrophica]|uniref:hypothetical protein n=1 Tax=Xylanimonas oleitrophica TaxID=2607479 RepID=UPI0015D014A5|nr:hypothetical protein [Xylanimonas oleitrophica]